MKYYIKRELNEYGPYTLADLQRYVAQGNILVTDLARSEGLTDWTPVSQILGSVSAPPPAPAPAPVPAAGTAYAAGTPQPATLQPVTPQPVAPQPAPVYAAAPAQAVPGLVPPDLHWALVLVIGFFCFIFPLVWLFIEAGFVKKLKPQSNFLALLITGACVQIASIFIFYVGIFAMAASGSNEPPVVPILLFFMTAVVGAVLFLVGIFKMRSAIQEYYNTVEPINLRLSGVMTFFFAVYYFQHHFTRIAQWKKTGVLVPQG